MDKLLFKEEQPSLQSLKTYRSGEPYADNAEDDPCLVVGEVGTVPQSPPPSLLYVPFPRYGQGILLGKKHCCLGGYIFAQCIWKLKFLTSSLALPLGFLRVGAFLNPSAGRGGQNIGEKEAWVNNSFYPNPGRGDPFLENA